MVARVSSVITVGIIEKLTEVKGYDDVCVEPVGWLQMALPIAENLGWDGYQMH